MKPFGQCVVAEGLARRPPRGRTNAIRAEETARQRCQDLGDLEGSGPVIYAAPAAGRAQAN